MASSSNGNGNIMDEFEEAFQACLHALTKQESNAGVTKEEIELEVQQTANKFIDVARQMEAFFLQKRFLISALKPEMLLKDENQELKYEISRKDALINKHYNRLEEWKQLLSDQQQQGYSKSITTPQQSDLRSVNNPGSVGGSGLSSNAGPSGTMGSGMVPPGGMTNVLQAQLQQQQHLAAQQQQQQMMQAQAQQMQQMQAGTQQMYMQQQSGVGGPLVNRSTMGFNQNAGTGGSGGGGVGVGLAGTGGSNNMLQGPLAYLEKTASNIDLVGMGDGRR